MGIGGTPYFGAASGMGGTPYSGTAGAGGAAVAVTEALAVAEAGAAGSPPALGWLLSSGGTGGTPYSGATSGTVGTAGAPYLGADSHAVAVAIVRPNTTAAAVRGTEPSRARRTGSPQWKHAVSCNFR